MIDPRRVSLPISAVLAAVLVTAVGVSVPAVGAAGPTTLAVEGTLEVVAIDSFGADAHADHLYTVVTDDGAEIPVDLDEDAPANGRFRGELVVEGAVASALRSQGLLPRTGATIDEDTRAGRTAVAAAEDQTTPLEVAHSIVTAPATASTPVPSAHRAYVARMTDQGSVDGTDEAVLASVRGSLKYWVEESAGAITSFEAPVVLRSFDSTADVPPAQGCGMGDPFPIWDQAAGLFPGVDFTLPGNHLIVVVGDECAATGAIGVGTVGSSIDDGGASILAFDPTVLHSVAAHEIGHNFGLGHANLDGCADPADCGYLDLYSPMGLGITGVTFYPPALGTLYRRQLGLTTPGEVGSVTPTTDEPVRSRTFALSPRSAASGLRGLVVGDPETGATYSIDWRRHTERDAYSFYGSSNELDAPRPLYRAGVVVERQGVATDGTVDGDIHLATRPVAGRVVGSFPAGTSFSPSARLTVTVNATGNDSADATASVTVTVDGRALPVIESSTPTVNGTAAVGRTMIADAGAWTSGATLTYDWRVDGVSTGHVGQSFSVPAAAFGKRLTVAVTGTAGGHLSTTKTSTGSVVEAGLFSPGSVMADGSASVGSTVAVSTAGWPSDAGMTYQWFADSTPVAGATGPTFLVPASLLGRGLRVVATGTRAGYTTQSSASASRAVSAGSLRAATPRIAGTARVGRTLKVKVGAWSPRPSYRYQWYAGGRAITSKGTKSSFVLTSRQKGKRITVRVTARKTGYVTAAKTSAKSKKVARRR